MARFLNTSVFAIFLMTLLIPGLIGIVQSDTEILEDENRTAAPWPNFPRTLPDIRDYPRALDDYLSDHFGLRRQMIEKWRAARAAVDGISGSSRVLAGDAGWLFFNEEQVVERSAGRLVIDGNAERILAVAQDAQQLARQQGATFAVLPAPNKHTIYAQFLPPFARGTETAQTELDMFLHLAGEAGLPVTDTREILRAAAQPSQPVYFLGDTHWNQLGAALAFDEVMSLWGLEPQRIDALARLTAVEKEQRDGDLVRFADLDGAFLDLVPTLDLDALGPRPAGKLTNLADRDSQPSYVIDYERDGPVVLVIGDSFTRNLFRPFWRHFAGKVYWTHHATGQYDRSIFERAQPDYVLFQFVERAQF